MRGDLSSQGRVERTVIWVIAWILVPTFQAVPFAIGLVVLRANNDAGGWVQVTRDWMDSHLLVASAFVIVYLVAINFIARKITKWGPRSELANMKGVLTLIEILESIVGQKSKRFSEHASRIQSESGPMDARHIFLGITRPEQQLALLVQGIYTFFEAIDRHNVTFEVSAAIIDDSGQATEWLYFWPESAPPVVEFEQLNSPRSSVRHCVNRRKLIVVEDTAREARKRNGCYVPHDEEDPEQGSLICYPIIHLGNVAYVITVFANKPRAFQRRKSELYKWAMKHFAVRMTLEQSLLILKRMAEENADQEKTIPDGQQGNQCSPQTH